MELKEEITKLVQGMIAGSENFLVEVKVTPGKVLVTLDPANYPLGKKNIIHDGDIPVVWTNIKYKMLYMNMGHGDKNFDSPVQNQMYVDAMMWLGGK